MKLLQGVFSDIKVTKARQWFTLAISLIIATIVGLIVNQFSTYIELSSFFTIEVNFWFGFVVTLSLIHLFLILKDHKDNIKAE